MRIYLGADWKRREELQGYARDLEALGHIVTSSWLWTEANDKDYRSRWEEQAKMDCKNIAESDVCVFFTEQPGTMSRGGRHVEFGYALSLQRYNWNIRKTYVVGPIESQFYTLASGYASDFVELLMWEEFK